MFRDSDNLRAIAARDNPPPDTAGEFRPILHSDHSPNIEGCSLFDRNYLLTFRPEPTACPLGDLESGNERAVDGIDDRDLLVDGPLAADFDQRVRHSEKLRSQTRSHTAFGLARCVTACGRGFGPVGVVAFGARARSAWFRAAWRGFARSAWFRACSVQIGTAAPYERTRRFGKARSVSASGPQWYSEDQSGCGDDDHPGGGEREPDVARREAESEQRGTSGNQDRPPTVRAEEAQSPAPSSISACHSPPGGSRHGEPRTGSRCPMMRVRPPEK